MSSQIISNEAEAASALLFKTLGAHRTAAAAFKSQPSVRLHHLLPADARQVQRQSTLLRLISITESFAGDLLTREMEVIVARADSSPVDVIWDDAAVKATSSWREQREAYKKWFGVTQVDWSVIDKLAHARNAVAHGLGNLTRRQLRDLASVRSALQSVNITLNGTRIVLTDDTLSNAAQSCRKLIYDLDLAVQVRPRKYR